MACTKNTDHGFAAFSLIIGRLGIGFLMTFITVIYPRSFEKITRKLCHYVLHEDVFTSNCSIL